MIRAVVVDDERLVRKGFISLIDWASLGIIIVGEAGDGKAALELLEQREVDLLFVDITMPGMSGFDLIRHVRQCFPSIFSVVLTCHHEFDYVQEALRLGAVDYIVKTLLEVENADIVIRRIVDRINWEDSRRSVPMVGQEKMMNADSALIFTPLFLNNQERDLYQLTVVRRNQLLVLDDMWMSPLVHSIPKEELQNEIKNHLEGRWQTVVVTGLANHALETVNRTLQYNLPQMLFYAADNEGLITFTYHDMIHPNAKPMELTMNVLAEADDLRWALDSTEWELFVHKVWKHRPTAAVLSTFGHMLCQTWEGLLFSSDEIVQLKAAIERNITWSHWKTWLRRFSDQMQRRMVELSLTKEVMFCLIKAILYMNRHAGEKINQADVAAHINMSRSYFSQCFTRFAGETFGEKLRQMRLNLAKSLLLETTYPVYEVASLAGFEDDRYFSKLFRERVGKLPNEFRCDGGKL
ncbi:response regulator transcription factor [Paenibacillus segetis]|uniref:Two-component system, response regulator YesN n=1 Tax=Paenibacillus segetis TaxID=1325360 RepID=A0ABQ1YEY8_9BACL|nr:response regulator [Paenibacillus segetis]GGH21944.1 hypothetical protein GCM10008013_20140 [Paenibacillus segetis]